MGFLVPFAITLALALAMYAYRPISRVRSTHLAVIFAVGGAALAGVSGAVGLVLPWPYGAAAAGLFAASVAAILVSQERRLGSLLRATCHPQSHEAAIHDLQIHDLLAYLNAEGEDRTRDTWDAADYLVDAGQPDAALKVLFAPVTDRMPELYRKQFAYRRVSCCIALGDLERARAVLDQQCLAEMKRTVPGTALTAQEALLLALEGHADQALAIDLRMRDRRNSEEVRRTLLLARAHAHAVRGDVRGSSDALRELMHFDPRAWLEWARRPVGPATEIAMGLASGSVPYR